MLNAATPILGFAAYSGAGKTTLLARLIPLLKQQNLRIGLIKHSHHDFDVDQPGKDSYRLRTAGASPVLLVSKYRRAVITEFSGNREPLLAEQLPSFDQTQLDLILVEGFRNEGFPKIEVYRANLNKPLLFPADASIIAIATDAAALPVPDTLTVLNLNDPEMIAEFILQRFIRRTHA